MVVSEDWKGAMSQLSSRRVFGGREERLLRGM